MNTQATEATGATDAADAALIALDWGSSSLRAYAMSADGRVLGARRSEGGASRLAAEADAADRTAVFERHLRELLGGWLVPGRPLLACGMIGSAHGWIEAEYVPCPLDLAELHRHLAVARGRDGLALHIVPGISYRPDGQAPDVMRGEETKVVGLLEGPATGTRGDAWIVLPGTHSKWVRVEDGRLVSFATRMTGELFDVLRSHSVLARSVEASTGFDAAAFDRGLRRACAAGGADLSHHLFGVRTLGLFHALSPAALGDFLSGLLIGHELASALPEVDAALPLILVGDDRLCTRYRHALGVFGREAAVFDDPAPHGLWRVAHAAGLV
jgi:2-dehydro-3-deoxygalactonokinase